MDNIKEQKTEIPGQDRKLHKAQNRELVGMGKAVKKLSESTEG